MRQPPNSFNSRFDNGIDEIEVRLWEEMDPQAEAAKVAAFYRSTWGDIGVPDGGDPEDWMIAQEAAAGKVLPNCLETISLTFGISGVSRAHTHQLVRTRVGAGFGQQGGRDNNWSDFNFRIPQTWLEMGEYAKSVSFAREVERFIDEARDIYAQAIELGIPFQDARYVLPMGLETSIVGTYNLLSLKSLLNRRLCNRMMWETNYVARRMHDQVVLALPWVGKSLRSTCERVGICQSVSPMFPPSCWHKGAKAVDNQTLRDDAQQDYDWSIEANGSDLHFGVLDKERTIKEMQRPDRIYSLLIPDRVLAECDSGGMWESV